jgi:hypothetical protein
MKNVKSIKFATAKGLLEMAKSVRLSIKVWRVLARGSIDSDPKVVSIRDFK